MPSSARMTYTDIDAFSAVFQSPSCEFTTGRPDRFRARCTLLDFQRIGMQRVSEDIPRLGHFEIPRTHVAISFQADPGPPIHVSGVELGAEQIGVHAPGALVFQRVSGPTTWGTVYLPVAALAEIGAAAGGRGLVLSPGTLVAAVPPLVLARLRQLHAEVAALVEAAPGVLANPDAGRGLEQALAERFLDCLSAPERRDASATCQRHVGILRKLREIAEAQKDEPLYMLELCAALGTSPRRLQEVCHDYLGMSPKRFLLLRRMQLVHRALSQADPLETSVTEIAMRHGFWELGRFAVAYRSLFGVPPSRTLQRSAGSEARQPN